MSVLTSLQTYKVGVHFEALYEGLFMLPWNPGTLKLDSILPLFKCAFPLLSLICPSHFFQCIETLHCTFLTVVHFPGSQKPCLYYIWPSHIFQQQESLIYTVYDCRTFSSSILLLMEDFLHHLRGMDYFLPKILSLENVRYAVSWVWNLCDNVALFPHLNLGHFPADIFQSSD